MVEARAYHYQDDSGLLVGTYGVAGRQRVRNTTVEAKALADYVRIDPGQAYDPSQAVTGSRPPDAVTSASSTAGGGAVARKWRFEGQAGFTYDCPIRARPAWIGALARASTEPDYRSLSAALRSGVELFDRNTTVTALLGYGHDTVDPVEAPPGQRGQWPATHERWAAIVSLSQLLSPTLMLSTGLGLTRQRGRLSNPYRRAIVNTLLLPEAMPDARDRATGFIGLSWYVADGAALHVRQGLYADTWGVRAIIPEATLAIEPEPGTVVSATYRYYGQTAASFYQVVYPEVAPLMTGDLRLGIVRDHNVGLNLRWLPETVALPVLAGYNVSILDYVGAGARVVAHVFWFGFEAYH